MNLPGSDWIGWVIGGALILYPILAGILYWVLLWWGDRSD